MVIFVCIYIERERVLYIHYILYMLYFIIYTLEITSPAKSARTSGACRAIDATSALLFWRRTCSVGSLGNPPTTWASLYIYIYIIIIIIVAITIAIYNKII